LRENRPRQSTRGRRTIGLELTDLSACQWRAGSARSTPSFFPIRDRGRGRGRVQGGARTKV